MLAALSDACLSTMNRPAASPFAPGPLALASLIVIAALTRLLPHPPNFSPVEAIALFGGAYFASRAWAFVVPLVAMFASDFVLGLVHGGTYFSYFSHAGFWLVYACIALSTLMGFGLRGRVGGGRVLGYSLAGSVLFFVVTNFGAWLGSPMYPQTGAGLAAAYVAGVPFFQWTVLGTLAYAALLFGGFALLRRQVPALRAQTV
jgi:hypothetical protein